MKPEFNGTFSCTQILGLCLVIWLLIFLLSLCILPLLCACLCHQCGYLKKTAVWTKLQELGLFRSKRQDLETGVGVPRTTSPTQKHNEGIPRPPDTSPFPATRIPDIQPHKATGKKRDDTAPDYYNIEDGNGYETDSASHGLVSLASTVRSRTGTSEGVRLSVCCRQFWYLRRREFLLVGIVVPAGQLQRREKRTSRRSYQPVPGRELPPSGKILKY